MPIELALATGAVSWWVGGVGILGGCAGPLRRRRLTVAYLLSRHREICVYASLRLCIYMSVCVRMFVYLWQLDRLLTGGTKGSRSPSPDAQSSASTPRLCRVSLCHRVRVRVLPWCPSMLFDICRDAKEATAGD